MAITTLTMSDKVRGELLKTMASVRGYRIPFFTASVAERMEPFLTGALIGDKDAYDSLSNFAHHHYPEYLPTVRAIKEKYGYAD
jgi:hypothetical protein